MTHTHTFQQTHVLEGTIHAKCGCGAASVQRQTAPGVAVVTVFDAAGNKESEYPVMASEPEEEPNPVQPTA